MQITYEVMDLLAEIAKSRGIMPTAKGLDELHRHVSLQQKALITHQSRFRCTRAGRRAGKSVALGYWLCGGWETRPGQHSLFVARTRGHARDILWDTLKDLNEQWHWGASTNEQRLEMTFPNGYTVRLRGCENVKQAEKMRGTFYWRVAIDECHLYPDHLLRHLWVKVIRPLLSDLLGECIFSGTPGYDLDGLWFTKSLDPEEFPEEAKKSGYDQWPTFCWDMRQNPYLPDPEGEMAAVLAENCWAPDNPDFQREWLGKWVRNAAEKCYDVFDALQNTYLEEDLDAPRLWSPGAPGLRTVIGVDVGWEDGCGFAVAQKRFDSPTIRIPEAHRECEMDDIAIAHFIKGLMRKYKTRWVYMDSKGNKNTCMSMRSLGVPAEPAVGGEKRPHIEYIRSLLKAGTLQAHAQDASELIDEWKFLPWGFKRSRDVDGNEYLHKAGHKEGFVDETADAAINSIIMFTQKYVERLEEAAPAPGTPEYTAHVERQERESVRSKAHRNERESGGRKRASRRRG